MAGNSTRDIKRRIVSVQKTSKITSALKMVAAAKFKKINKQVEKNKHYQQKLDLIMQQFAQRNIDVEHQYLKLNETGKELYVLFTSDKGLCGGFNQSVFKYVLNNLDLDANYCIIGSKGINYFKNKLKNIVYKLNDLDQKDEDQEFHNILNLIEEGYKNKEISKVFLIYNHYNSSAAHANSKQLLPIQKPEVESIDEYNSDFIYEPSAEVVFETLLKEFLYFQLVEASIESRASELRSRMIAMDSATDNAYEMIKKLTLVFNRMRQAAITQEIAEIVAGAEGQK